MIPYVVLYNSCIQIFRIIILEHVVMTSRCPNFFFIKHSGQLAHNLPSLKISCKYLLYFSQIRVYKIRQNYHDIINIYWYLNMSQLLYIVGWRNFDFFQSFSNYDCGRTTKGIILKLSAQLDKIPNFLKNVLSLGGKRRCGLASPRILVRFDLF